MGKTQIATQWMPITKPGQVKVGAKLRFTIGSEKYNETAKLILDAGTDKEEIIYNRRQNYYLITSMCIKNKGSQKNVEYLAEVIPACGDPDCNACDKVPVAPMPSERKPASQMLTVGQMESLIVEQASRINELEAQLATPAPTAPTDRERRWAKHLAKDDSSDLACAECYPHGHLLKSGYKCIRHDAIALLAAPAPTAPTAPSDDALANVATQCLATATSEIAANVLVDGEKGTLCELLQDAAAAIMSRTTLTPSDAVAIRSDALEEATALCMMIGGSELTEERRKAALYCARRIREARGFSDHLLDVNDTLALAKSALAG